MTDAERIMLADRLEFFGRACKRSYEDTEDLNLMAHDCADHAKDFLDAAHFIRTTPMM